MLAILNFHLIHLIYNASARLTNSNVRAALIPTVSVTARPAYSCRSYWEQCGWSHISASFLHGLLWSWHRRLEFLFTSVVGISCLLVAPACNTLRTRNVAASGSTSDSVKPVYHQLRLAIYSLSAPFFYIVALFLFNLFIYPIGQIRRKSLASVCLSVCHRSFLRS